MNELTKEKGKDRAITSSADILSSLKAGSWAKSGVPQEKLDAVNRSRIESWMKTNPKLTVEEEQSLREKLNEIRI